MPANSADPRMARNGGTFLIVNSTSSASGSRLSDADVERRPSASRAASVLTPPSGSAVSPSTRKMSEADAERGAGSPEHVADVLAGREATADELGTRIVVSESGVILSPK